MANYLNRQLELKEPEAMPDKKHLGSFALDCWVSPSSHDDPTTIYSDDRNELRTEALKILRGGHFRFLVLFGWHAIKKDWIELEELTPDVR